MPDRNDAMKEALVNAIYKEIGASNFYRNIGGSITNSGGKKIFLSLSDDEQGHREKLESWYKKLFNEKFIPSPSKIRESEIRGIAVGEVAGALAALDIAIEAEGNANDFYQKEADKAVEKDLKSLFLSLAEEELGHYNLLLAEKNSLIDSFYWFDMDSTTFMED
ncbi:MAG: ferritin family protein [Candidatus Krumholzibacteriota bacterium]|nr:ferritin family protein [Candidatus Krumholzibacteriota bacterium]